MMQRTWKHLMWKQRCVMVLVLFGCSGVLSNAYAAAITDAQATGLATVYGEALKSGDVGMLQNIFATDRVV